jgi:DNA-binding CsgD family transcriptional regulator/PAS domain-containing protein
MSIFARHDLDQERQAIVMHRAWELAMTGKHSDASAVLAQLRNEKFSDVEKWLNARYLRSKMDDVCNRAARAKLLSIPVLQGNGDAEAIWQTLTIENAAWWMRDFDAYAACFLQSPRFKFHAWVREEGMTIRTGWDAFAKRTREDIVRDPIPNPYFAFENTIENRNITVIGDMAWCTYTLVYQTADLPGFRGPGREEVVRVVERHKDKWLTAFYGFFNLNFGQTDAPLWEVDHRGTVVWQNPAAKAYLEGDSDAVLRAGRLHFREQQADEKLAEALTTIVDLDYGFLSRRRSMPVVVDAGYDLPATVWWVIAENGKLTISFNDQPLLLARLDTASKAFGLSPAQHRLASALVEGMQLTDAAEREGVSLSTAKTQLQRVFDKVGVRTQPALVRALLAVTERN